jgi:hypothetical protein
MVSVLRVKDKNGNVINIPAIKGEPGKDYVLTDADKQEIADLVGGGSGGGSGADGFSPIVNVEAIEGGHRVTITDVEGEKSFDVLNGVDGKDGQNGKDGNDYILTDTDKTEIANTVVALLPKYNGEVAEV